MQSHGFVLASHQSLDHTPRTSCMQHGHPIPAKVAIHLTLMQARSLAGVCLQGG
jgi:hypothetical protein